MHNLKPCSDTHSKARVRTVSTRNTNNIPFPKQKKKTRGKISGFIFMFRTLDFFSSRRTVVLAVAAGPVASSGTVFSDCGPSCHAPRERVYVRASVTSWRGELVHDVNLIVLKRELYTE